MLDFSSELVAGGGAGSGREGGGLLGAGATGGGSLRAERQGGLRLPGVMWMNAGCRSSWNAVRLAIEFIGQIKFGLLCEVLLY